MRFELKGTRPSILTIIFLLVMSVYLPFFGSIFLPPPLSWLFYLGALLVAFSFLYYVYLFVSGKSVRAVETGEEYLALELHNGEKSRYKYQDISTLIFIPSLSTFGRRTFMLSFFYKVRAGPWETSKYISFKVPDEKITKAIAEEIETHSVKMDPSVEALRKAV